MLPLIPIALAAIGGYLLFSNNEEKQDDEHKQPDENTGGKRRGGGDNPTNPEGASKEGLTEDKEAKQTVEGSIMEPEQNDISEEEV